MNQPLRPPLTMLPALRRGGLIGAVLRYLAMTIILLSVFGNRAESRWWLPTTLAGMFVGSAVGGVVERRRGGRVGEVGQFLRRQAVAALLGGQLLVATGAGERWYGAVGLWAGLLVGVVVLTGGLWLAERGRWCSAEPGAAADRGLHSDS